MIKHTKIKVEYKSAYTLSVRCEKHIKR